MTGLKVDDARREALFASRLQRSDAPDSEAVAEAIRATVRQFGSRGCTGRMAQEFGDHPEEAAERMRWVRQLLADTPPRRRPGCRLPALRNAPPHAHATTGAARELAPSAVSRNASHSRR